MSYRLTFSLVLFSLAFNACTQNDTVNPSSYRLKMTVGSEGDSMLYSSYIYDSLNRLIAIKDSGNNNRGSYTTVIEYNAHDKPVKISVINNYYGFPQSLDTLIYNSNQQVIRRKYGPNNGDAYHWSNSYVYDSKGRLVVDSGFGFGASANTGEYSYSKFTYDNNDNVVKVQSSYRSLNTINDGPVITLTYGDKPNPLNSIGILVYFLYRGSYFPSKNNILTKTVHYTNSSVDYKANYKYEFENGLVKKMIIQDREVNQGPNSQLEFFYE